jgi:DNA-directed RNA polymerase subunit RPC12/RpoP
MCFRPAQVSVPIKCPECGSMNPFNVMRCRKCKAVLQNDLQMVKCPACGRLSLLESGECDDCGLDFQKIQAMIDSGELAREEVIVHADGSPIDWSKTQVTDVGGSAAAPPPRPPCAPGTPTAPNIPTAPKPPTVPPAAQPKPPTTP